MIVVLTLVLFYIGTQAKQELWKNWSEKRCPCTTEYNPICSSDMRRYKNICTFQCRIQHLIKNNEHMIKPVNCTLLPPTVPN
ncbi:unnamed protein product [Parnassius apollo]|uniref:(apollo) hypothetical protein n=1 Tax=Parnassius apollo TaxID=110799 RepID=A0A8S3WFC7_PARAO|nr:unnamed protein product [Parnassius apollo]